jgi:RNA polymerase subunit RPABC4/transcription elongation factor Spt4
LNESAFGSSKQEYANIDDLQPTTTIEVHGNYVQNIDNSSKHEIQVGGDYLEKSAIKATDSTILSKSTNSPPELSETEREQQTIRQALINSPDAVDSSVLREMLKQGTNRVFSETSDEKMESLSESQRDPLAIESPVQEDSTGQREMASSGGETGRERSLGGAKCNSCSFLIQEGWKVCPSCGTAITVLCRHCGAELKPGWNNCPECGLATDR